MRTMNTNQGAALVYICIIAIFGFGFLLLAEPNDPTESYIPKHNLHNSIISHQINQFGQRSR